MLRSLKDNPEIVQRLQREMNSMPLCALVSPFSQLFQTVKAAGGIIYPGIYYQNDPFVPVFQVLTDTAIEVGCSQELVECFLEGSKIIHNALKGGIANRDYYYEIFRRDLTFIAEKMNSTEIPKSRKLMLLNILDPCHSKSGIRGCAPALGRLLQHIVDHLSIPEDPHEAIKHLSDQFKSEIINRMIMKADNTSHAQCVVARQCNHHWENVVASMAHDPSHRGNAFVVAMGRKIGVSEAMYQRAANDNMAHRIQPLTPEQEMYVLRAFNSYYTHDELVKSLMEQINSKPDGSPGLKLLRENIFEILAARYAERVRTGEDTTFEAVRHYYLNKGEGRPTDPSFTDLNEYAIEDILEGP
jgi:hypothetical protein